MTLPYAQAHDIGVLVYGPLAHGLLGGGMTEESRFANDDWRSKSEVSRGEEFRRNLRVVDALKRFAEFELGTTVDRLAIAWVLANTAVQVAIVGTRHARHVDAALAATERLAQEVARPRTDLLFVDAPVSGSRGPARTGGLLILAGGPEPAHGRPAPVFAALGQRTQWLGGVGAGSRMKLVLNTRLAFEIEAVAEVRALAARLEISFAQLADTLNTGPLASAFETSKLAKMESGDDSPDFSLEWALKDLDLVLGVAGPATAPVTASIAARWRDLVTQGFGRLDVSAAHLGLDSGTKQEVAA